MVTMKVEKTKPKRNISELPHGCKELIDKLHKCPENELVSELRKVNTWSFGKCELYHWVEVLNRFDGILAHATEAPANEECEYLYMCPKLADRRLKEMVISVLHFTALLIEHSYARHIYNSMEHLNCLLSSTDLDVVIAVLNLIYVFSKRSNFLSRVTNKQKLKLNTFLETLGESWGGKENGLSLASCCQEGDCQLPPTATSVYFELMATPKGFAISKQWSNSSSSTLQPLWLKDVDKDPSSLSDMMQQLTAQYTVSSNKQHQWITLIVKIRLAKYFSDYKHRMKCIQARLQAIAILVYSGATTDVVDPLLYSGFVEELVEVLELKQPNLHEVKASCLRALTAMIHLERDPKLSAIIEATGASTYHGFLPSLVRECITSLTDTNAETYPQTLATALFSFLYHLATYEASGDALVSSGIMESLLQVVDWQSPDPSCITFVTRAVRVIDLITNLDMTAFHSLGGWNKLLWRLKHEVDCCKEELPFILPSEVPVVQQQQQHEAAGEPQSSSAGDTVSGEAEEMSSSDQATTSAAEATTEDISMAEVSLDPAVSSDAQLQVVEPMELDHLAIPTAIIPTELQCLPQRAALIKSILNFFKKAIPDPTFAENIRNLVDSSLPESLKHIVSNAEYYGPSIYLPATEVMTVFVFHEPSQLSALQDNGLPGVVLNSLLMKNVPATREVLGSVPNILSALCLNARGLQIFTDAQPFERLLKVLVDPLYLPAMRRRKGTVEQIGDTVCNLGIAMDELMRHQPTLKGSVIAGLIELLKQVRLLGLQQVVSLGTSNASQKVSTEAGCSDEEDDDIDDEVASTTSHKSQAEEGRNVSGKKAAVSVPIMEYVLHVVHFLDAILSTNSTDDHIKEFMQQKGLPALLDLATMVSLPLDFAASNACSAIATACKGILHIGHERLVLMELFIKLNALLQEVECFVNSPKRAEGSVLLEEVTTCRNVEDVSESFVDTPVLHNLACINSLLTLCVHLSRTNQIEPRVIIVNQWGSGDGLHILESLLSLYRALLWEGFTLLAIADSYKEETDKQEQVLAEGSSGDLPLVCDEVMPKSGHSSPSLKHLSPSLKHLTPLVAVTSRVGKSIAELLSLMVRLATGPLHRHHRRSLHPPVMTQPPPKEAVKMCQSIASVLVDGLSWSVPLPRLQPCVLTSSLGQWLFEGMTFTLYLVEMSEFLLFDDRKRPYHLMLMHFDKFKGLAALTQCFHKAMSALKNTKNTNIDGSCVDFLDGWLNLVEKLLNAQSIVDSPHSIVNASTSAATNQQVTFDAITFVMKAQQYLAPCLLQLWDSKLLERFTPHVVELLLSCLRLLIAGEQMINSDVEKKGKSSTTAKNGQSSASVGPLHHVSSTLPTTGRVDAVSLQQLMDMGFTRDHATDALLVCGNNLTAAMEWILTHPPTEDTTASGADTLLTSGGLSEEEQMMRAIALSLELGGEAEGSSSSSKKIEPEELKEIPPRPLDRTVLDGFTGNLMTNCLKLIDTVPDAAHKLCSLFTAVGRRNGVEWQEAAMLQLRNEALIPLCEEVVQIYSDDGRKENACDAKLKCRLHLVALLLEEMPKVCADVFCVPDLRRLLVLLLQLVSKDANTFICPLWLIGLLLLMDSIERVVLYCKWKFSTKEDCDYVWQWFDEIAHRWCSYSTEDSAAMERAYQTAEPSVKVSSGRQRYVVQFGPMLQVNVDTGTRRPVMRTPTFKTRSKENDKSASSKTETDNKAGEDGSSDPNKVKLDSATASSSQEIPVTTKEQARKYHISFSLEESLEIIKNCTQLIACPLDQNTLHAALRLCLRFTRDHLHAEEFVKCEGPQALLAKKRDSSFKGFSSLTVLLLRHVMECNSTLAQTMENVIRSVVTNNRPVTRELSYSSGHRELHLVMRRLAPVACRNTDKFMEKSSALLRVNNRPTKIEQHRSGAGHRIPATIVHCIPTSQQKPAPPHCPPVLTLHVDVINMLIDRLCTIEEETKVQQAISALDSNQLLYDSSSDTVHVQMGNVHVAGNERLSARAVSLTRDTTGNRGQRGQTLRSRPAEDDDDTSEDMNVEYNSSQAASPERKESKDTTAAVNVQQTEHILSKAGLMRLLTELVDSYPNCCQIVSESTRTIAVNGESKEMSFLAFVMEYLLPPDPSATSIPNISRQSKNFLQYVAMSSVSNAQSVFVYEFKNCFARALLLPESLVKHNWLRSLANLLSAILDKQSSLSARTAARMLVRKGMITDLARAVHCLDLNSSHLVSTINTILKPLESLTRFVNQVSALHHKQASSDDKSTAATTATETAVNTGQSQPSSGGQDVTMGEQPRSDEQQVDVANSQPVQNMDSTSLLDGIQSESLVPLEEEPQAEEDGEEDAGLLYPAANIVNDLVGDLIEEALLEQEQSASEDNSISDMETVSDEESDEPADVEDNCNSAGEEQESDEEESQDMIEEDEPDNMMLHYDEDDDDDDSSSHDHVSHQSEQDDEQSEELSSTSEDITDIIHEEIDMIPGEVATSTSARDEEQEEDNEEEDDEDEESLDLDDMDAEYEHDLDVYHPDPEDYVQVGIPYGNWRDVGGGWENHLQHSGLLARHLHTSGGTYSVMDGSDHVSSSTSTATASQLPARHPMLSHQDIHQEHSTSLGFATYREINGTAVSHSLPAIDHSENTIPQSSSALAQLLSTSSAHDVLRLNRSSLSTPQPSAVTTASVNVTASHESNRTSTEDLGNLTNIPSTYSRWTEECEALDGSIQHLCISSLKPSIITALEKTYEEENKRKGDAKEDNKSSTSAATTDSTVSSSLERTVRNRIASATASVNSAIDNLHASLQSVANTLAGTAEMVRSGLNAAAAAVTSATGNSDDRGGQENTTERQDDNAVATTTPLTENTVDENVIEPMALSSDDTTPVTLESRQSALVEPFFPPPLLPVSVPVNIVPVSIVPVSIALPTSSTVTMPSESSLSSSGATPSAQTTTTTNSAPPTALFDGSQESAAAVLQNTDPADPMYMFLSAVAGAPAPPLPQSSTSTATSVPPAQELEDALHHQRRSDALRIASHIADMLQSDTLPQADDEDDDEEEEDEEGEQAELVGITDRVTTSASGTNSTTSLSTPVTSTLAVSATSSNSTSPCTTLAPQLLSGLQVQPAITESLSSGRSEMVGDIIQLRGLVHGAVVTASPSTTTSNNTAVSVASTAAATTDVLSSMPEELDSTFLEALPESIREELVSQHAAEMQRRQLQARRSRNDASDGNFVSTISPEFLAALPPNIQEEVLAQERQQAAAASQTTSQQSHQPTDPSLFLRNLPTSLRRTVLADMDDSILQHLPHEYVTEAQTLRQEHTRQMYEDRSAALLEHVFNSGGWVPEPISGMIPHRHFLSFDPIRAVNWRGRPNMGASSNSNLQASKKGEGAKQMLDQEGLACLLLLFFVDQNKLHVSRLHRVIKNLCQHPQTRAWMLASILSILQESCCSSSLLSNESQPPEIHIVTGAAQNVGNFSWLNLSISAALGCHAPVLHFNKTGSNNAVTIHPYASSILSNCMLELLIFLARLFPDSFLPQQLMPGEHKECDKTVISNFWQLLLKLDSMNSKKGKGSSKAFVLKDDNVEQKESELFSSSIVGQLMKMFNHPIIFGSTSLTDKLFRLLALVTASIPKTGFVKKGAQSKDQSKGENKSNSTNQTKDESKNEDEEPSGDVQVDNQPDDGSSNMQEEGSDTVPVPDVEVVSKIPFSQEECGSCSDIAVFDASLCPSVEKQLLKDTIHTLIVGKCSEDGLEDATQFLIQLSRADHSTREIVLSLLLKGVCSLGQNVCEQINALLLQLEENKASFSRQSSVDDESLAASVTTSSALTAVITGRNTTDHSHDIHLPAMVPLSCKASQQSFFLRLLKVVCQLRESALNAVNSNRAASSTRNSLLSEEPPDANSTPAPSANTDEMVVPSRTNSNDQPQASDDGERKEEQVVTKPTTNVSALRQQQHSPSVIRPLSSLLGLTNLWDMLSQCLCSLADTQDSHAVLVLQPAVEAFFLVHAERSSDAKLPPSSSHSSHSVSASRLKDDINPVSPAAFSDLSPHPSQSEMDQDQYAQLPQDTVLFLKFADKHRVVLNQILRQSTIPLADGPFAMLVNHTKVLDFDVKRRYFRQEMERLEEGSRRNDLVVHVRRDHVFEDSFRELHRRSPDEMKSNLYISFEGEEGQDAGGLLREWYLIISRDIFNPNYALFTTTPGDKTTYMPNSSSHVNPDHLNYFKFVGRIIAKAIYDNKLLECYFTRSFYKHILGKHVHYTDMQAEDYSFYQGMVFLLEHDLNEIGAELTFSTEVQEFGLTEIRDLKPNGRNIPIVEENKREYVQLACQMKMTSSIRAQIKSFLEGFYEIIPKKLISIFNEQELELLISGMPTIDIDDLKQNTEYNKYTENSLQIQWFWRAMKSFEQEDRARFLQFVTGTSRVPLQGFASLEGMNGPQKFQIHRDDRSTERLPCAHTCFNQLDLPPYETYNKLRTQLLLAIRECPEGFGFA